MRYFPDHGYISKPYYFESAEEILPATILAIAYDRAGIETWGLFGPDYKPIIFAELSADMQKYAIEAMLTQSQKHISKYIDAIDAYSQEMDRMQKENI